MSSFRGHKIKKVNGVFVFSDTLKPVSETWKYIGCGFCGKKDTLEGHDGCLGTLNKKLVMNACCGHGEEKEAYVQFWDNSSLRGKEAFDSFDILKN